MSCRRGGTLSERKHLCPRCGRELITGESCECYMATRDGLRAKCPRFRARLSYRGCYYIECGWNKMKFMGKANRDAFYAKHCCGDPAECPRNEKKREEKPVEKVIHCVECAHCMKLGPRKDPLEPWEKGGDGSFFCDAWDMEMYAPYYNAETYYCADAEQRKEAGT